MNPQEILAALEGYQPTEMRSRAAVANALRMAMAGQGPSARVQEGTGPDMNPGMVPPENEIRPDYTMPRMKRQDQRDYFSINQDRTMRDVERDKMYPLPDRFYDQDHRAYPTITNKSHVIAEGGDEIGGGGGQTKMAGAEVDDILAQIQGLPPAGEKPEGDETSDQEATEAPGHDAREGYGPSLEFSDKTGPERIASQIEEKYIQQGLDPTSMHPLELKMANELMTTDQTRRNALFANEVIFANAILDDVDREGANWFAESFTGNSPYVVKLPGNLGNMMVSSKRQAYDMAKRLFIEGVLRPKTGAVINYSAEEPTYKDTFFPTPFDDEQTIKLKRAARMVEQDGVVNQAGPLYKPPDLSEYLPPEYLGSQPVGEGATEDGWMTLPSGKRYRIVK